MCIVCDIFKEATDKPSVSLWLVFIVTHLLISDNLIFKERRIDFISITRVMTV